MKKQMIVFIICLLVGGLALTGCKKKTSEVTSNDITISPAITPEASPIPTVTAGDSEENSLDTPEDNSIETKEEMEYISEEAAIKLIQKIIGERGYYFALVDSSLSLKDKTFYEYQISDGEEEIAPKVLVDKISGELYCYYDDGNVGDFSEHPLYTETSTEVNSTLEADFTKEDAFAKLNKVSAKDLDLPEALTKYKIIFDDWTTNVGGKVCYGINVYSDTEDKMISMGLYYVAVDNTSMYRFDSLLDDFVEIKEGQ
jgi:hypothetical protein